MSKKVLSSVCIAFLVLFMFSGCMSNRYVQRVDADVQEDLSGYWNDTDVKIITESIVQDCVNAAGISNFIKENGRYPVVLVGDFANNSDEHLDTSILARRFESALINSGRVAFVADASQRNLLRSERLDQLEWASEDTAKRLASETGADLMLVGSVNTIVDRTKDKIVRSYSVRAELIDIESNRKIWVGEDNSIKKIILKRAFGL